MPITSLFKQTEKLVVVVHVGVILDDEFLLYYQNLFQDDRFDKSHNLLVDLRRADSAIRTPEALREFAGIASAHYAGAETSTKVAVVASQDVSFGLARMYEVFSNKVPWEFVVFRSADAALAWLGLPEDLAIDIDESSQASGSSGAD